MFVGRAVYRVSMIIFLNRKTGEAIACGKDYIENVVYTVFGEGKRRLADFEKIEVHPATMVRFRAAGEQHLDVTTLGVPDGIWT